MHKIIHIWNPFDRRDNLTLFLKKTEHVSIFDPRGTLKVNGSHLGNTAISEVAFALIELCAKSYSFNILRPLAALL